MENTCVCCGEIIPEGSHVCKLCMANIMYDEKTCPECGAQLKVYYDGPNSEYHDSLLIRHCDECGCDWESDLYEIGIESELRRKFWG